MSDDSVSLEPTRVRWFYRDEVTKKWTPFSGYDSLVIELEYIRLMEIQSGIKLMGKSVEAVDNFKALLVRDGLYEVDIVARQCYAVYWDTPTGATEILRGIWFKDPSGPNCIPIDDEMMVEQLEITHSVLRRQLFGNNQSHSNSVCPNFDNDDECHIETASSIASIFSASPKPSCVHTLKFADCHVDWYSLDEVYLYVENATFYIRKKLGLQKVGTRLGRGYYEEADYNLVPPTFSHLCFVVHGMGQKYLKGSIITACDGIRETSRKLIDSYFPDIRASERRIQFLPVEWRNSLRLDGNIVDSITLDNLTCLRTFLNCTFMDIMYYTSPLYRYEINNSLRVELNRLYCLFCERHPYFEDQGGKVSILAHSLGCVISYDLITGWIEPVPSHLQLPLCAEGGENCWNDPLTSKLTGTISSGEKNLDEADMDKEDSSVLLAKLEAAKEVVKCLQSQLERRQLDDFVHRSPNDDHTLLFASRLENLFCMGSPLAVYLTLRGVRPGQTGAPDAIMPRSKCPHIYNIFHPADLVAYRLEPLILKHYCSIPPVGIYRCTDMDKIPYHIAHALSVPSAACSPSSPSITAQNFAPPEVFYIDQGQSNSSSSGLSSYSMLGYGSSSMESLNSIGSRFSRHLPLSSLMFGFFRSSGQSDAQPPPQPPSQISPKRSKSSSPSSKLSTDGFCVSTEEEEMATDSTVTFHLSPSSPSACSPDSDASPLSLDYRMDYQLKESRYESAYLSALTVHTSYWVNADLVMFVLMQCHPDSAPIDSPMTPL